MLLTVFTIMILIGNILNGRLKMVDWKYFGSSTYKYLLRTIVSVLNTKSSIIEKRLTFLKISSTNVIFKILVVINKRFVQSHPCFHFSFNLIESKYLKSFLIIFIIFKISELEYSYNQKGQLVIDGYPFVRSAIKGSVNTSIEWRCAETRKYKCSARIKTFGKSLKTKTVAHNHQPRKQKEVKAIIWNEILENKTK